MFSKLIRTSRLEWGVFFKHHHAWPVSRRAVRYAPDWQTVRWGRQHQKGHQSDFLGGRLHHPIPHCEKDLAGRFRPLPDSWRPWAVPHPTPPARARIGYPEPTGNRNGAIHRTDFGTGTVHPDSAGHLRTNRKRRTEKCNEPTAHIPPFRGDMCGVRFRFSVSVLECPIFSKKTNRKKPGTQAGWLVG